MPKAGIASTFCSLQLGLGGLDGRSHQVAHVAGCLGEVEAHAVAADALGDDVKVDAAMVSQSLLCHMSTSRKKEKRLTCSR